MSKHTAIQVATLIGLVMGFLIGRFLAKRPVWMFWPVLVLWGIVWISYLYLLGAFDR